MIWYDMIWYDIMYGKIWIEKKRILRGAWSIIMKWNEVFVSTLLYLIWRGYVENMFNLVVVSFVLFQ